LFVTSKEGAYGPRRLEMNLEQWKAFWGRVDKELGSFGLLWAGLSLSYMSLRAGCSEVFPVLVEAGVVLPDGRQALAKYSHPSLEYASLLSDLVWEVFHAIDKVKDVLETGGFTPQKCPWRGNQEAWAEYERNRARLFALILEEDLGNAVDAWWRASYTKDFLMVEEHVKRAIEFEQKFLREFETYVHKQF